MLLRLKISEVLLDGRKGLIFASLGLQRLEGFDPAWNQKAKFWKGLAEVLCLLD